MYPFKAEVKPVKTFIAFYIKLPSEWMKAGVSEASDFMKDYVHNSDCTLS